MYEQLDAVFLDPLDTPLMHSVIASQALLDQFDVAVFQRRDDALLLIEREREALAGEDGRVVGKLHFQLGQRADVDRRLRPAVGQLELFPGVRKLGIIMVREIPMFF